MNAPDSAGTLAAPPAVRINRDRYQAARLAMARAFMTYPLMRYAAPDESRRLLANQCLYGSMLSDALKHGEVYSTADVRGACCWLPPQQAHITVLRQVLAGMLALPLRYGLRGFNRLVDYDNVAREMHHQHAAGPHWYVAAIGVAPEFQGQGLCRRFFQPVLDRADAAGQACYLDTHDDKNVAIYQRCGFEVVDQRTPKGHPVPVWAMLRRPR
ncbi:MAG: GNAT family N-acetyltransferase [Pirellulales bacterium]|nr:GNAT family N-acetyltransferase [Pirellulales bacterium]